MEHRLWKEEYRIGVKNLDDDHIAICDLLERFLKAINDKEEKPTIGAIFGELRTKLNEHFRAEEQYLLEAGYPKKGRQEHIDGHMDVLYTLDHEFSNWRKRPAGSAHSEKLSPLCKWVWTELITADIQVKKQLEDLKDHA